MNQRKLVRSADGSLHERTWTINLEQAAQAQAWAKRVPALLTQECNEMASHFPHWLLVLAHEHKVVDCPTCGDLIVFAEESVRCVACKQTYRLHTGTQLAWRGLLPTLAPETPTLERRLAALESIGFGTLMSGAGRFLLAPISVIYPEQWPHVEPEVIYDSAFLRGLGMAPRLSAALHMLDGGRACLYTSGQWHAVTARVVLQQRVVNHLASLVKIAAGVPPEQAFIGRIHNDPWHPAQ